jgi:hypothetical protein
MKGLITLLIMEPTLPHATFTELAGEMAREQGVVNKKIQQKH